MRFGLAVAVSASKVWGAAFQSAYHVSVSAVTDSAQARGGQNGYTSRQRSVFARPDLAGTLRDGPAIGAGGGDAEGETRPFSSRSERANPPRDVISQPVLEAPLQVFSYQAAGLPFPQWLTDFTGMTEWPGMDPPYIPLDFIDFGKIPDWIKPYEQTHCDPAMRFKSCLFDCFNCAAFDDVYTCPVLLQTFDDGPSMATLSLLARLKQASTFFALGINTVRYPEIYRATVADGHVMGSHTWSHKFLPSLSNEQIIAQIQWLSWAMNATSGHLVKWFRPPYGGLDDRVRSILRQFGMQAVLWDFDTTDWKLLVPGNGEERREQDIFRDLAKFKKERGGRGLILEHDGVDRTVRVGINIHHGILGNVRQMTVPECVGGRAYIKTFN